MICLFFYNRERYKAVDDNHHISTDVGMECAEQRNRYHFAEVIPVMVRCSTKGFNFEFQKAFYKVAHLR